MRILCITFILLCPLLSSGQQGDSLIHKFTASFHTTSILVKSAPGNKFTPDHPFILDADVGWMRTNKKTWSYCNCYSQNGLSLSFINFDNPSQLGSAFTIAGFIEPYLINSKFFRLSLRGKAGLAFLDKLYDSISNRDNVFFSTKLSFGLGLAVNASLRINDHLRIKTGVQFNHISNGGRRDPNDGMNFAGVNLGIEYSLQPQLFPAHEKRKFTDKSLGIMVHSFVNQRTAQATGTFSEQQRLVLGLNAGLIKRIGRMNGLGVGGEYYYDGINAIYSQRYNSNIATTIGSASLQHYLFFGKLLFGQQLGWYITSNTGYQTNLFQRYVLEYEFKRNWYAGFSLKTHGDISDYFAFSTGYFFKF